MACYLQEFQPLQVSVKCVNNAECVEMLLKQGADATANDHAVRVACCRPSETAQSHEYILSNKASSYKMCMLIWTSEAVLQCLYI